MSFRPTILLILIVLLASCQNDLYKGKGTFAKPGISNEEAIVQFVIDSSVTNSILAHQNLQKVCDYTKLPYNASSVKFFNQEKKISAKLRVIIVQDTKALSDQKIDEITEFVALGGSLVVLSSSEDTRIMYLLGMNPEATFKRDTTSYGMHLVKDFLPGTKNLKINKDNSTHDGLDRANFSDAIDVIVNATNNPSYPLIFVNKVGRGTVVNYNSNEQFTKSYRALLFAQALIGLEGVPYPIANTSTIFLDDFPSPLYTIKKEPVKSEMDLTIAEFVAKVWWPDVRMVAKEENIPYTAYAIFDYNANIAPPFSYNEWDKNTTIINGKKEVISSWIGRDIIANGHEMALHGYNHVSLLEEDWKEPEYMSISLENASKKWKTSGFKALPISYVPPSNDIDSVGISQLIKGVPSIKYMQSTYLGEFKRGGDREFDPEPYNNKIFNYPRISSGFFLNVDITWEIESLYLYTGIWTHFIHPDDVFQVPDETNVKARGHYSYRNPNSLPWRANEKSIGLLDEYKKVITDFKQKHPLGQFYTATKGSELVKDWRYSYYYHVTEKKQYSVESDTNPVEGQYWFTYIDKENEFIFDRALKESAQKVAKTPFLNGSLYQIKTKLGYIKVPDLRFYGPQSNDTRQSILSEIQDEIGEYIERKEIMQPIANEIDDFVANGQLDKASAIYEDLIVKGTHLSTQQWQQYATYMVWQKKGDKVWETLETYYYNNENKAVADLSRKLHAITAYPTINYRKQWIERQINWQTKDKRVLKEYIDFFNTPENYNFIFMVLKDLYLLDPTPVNTKNYINFLNTNKHDSLLSVLNTITPCDSNYLDLAATIMWFYGDRGLYDQALAWEKCTPNVSEEVVETWLYNSSSFDELRKTDYPVYIELMLLKKPKRALQLLQSKNPCDPSLTPLSNKITTTFSDFGLYRDALNWSDCEASAIPFSKRMDWLYLLKEYPRLKKEYAAYSLKNPDDFESKIKMSQYLLALNELKAAAEITATLPKGVDYGKLKVSINTAIKGATVHDQRQITNTHEALLFNNIKSLLNRKLRMEDGNTVVAESNAVTDKLTPNFITNKLGAGVYDKNYNIHSLFATQSIMYPLQLRNRPGVYRDSINLRRDLIGLEYKFTRNNHHNLRYNIGVRLERDNTSTLFYQADLGVQLNRKMAFSAFNLKHFPVQSGPGYVLGLYHTQFSNYNEFLVDKNYTQIFALEANYYSDSEKAATALLRTELSVVNQNQFKLTPFGELVYGLGSVSRRIGFPYWMDDHRLIGGAGLKLTLGNEKSKVKAIFDAGYFKESDEQDFQRYTGNLSFTMFNYFNLKTGFEIYTIENYYSNAFQVGLNYNFK